MPASREVGQGLGQVYQASWPRLRVPVGQPAVQSRPYRTCAPRRRRDGPGVSLLWALHCSRPLAACNKHIHAPLTRNICRLFCSLPGDYGFDPLNLGARLLRTCCATRVVPTEGRVM